jgi:hypothetical protein
VSEVNRSAPLEIEDATPANVALDINELCGIVDNSSALRRDHKGEQCEHTLKNQRFQTAAIFSSLKRALVWICETNRGGLHHAN